MSNYSNRNLVEENFSSMARYSSSLGVELDEYENLMYYNGKLSITKSLNGNSWVITEDDKGYYILMHENTSISSGKKMNYHEQFRSKSYNVIMKSLITSHGIDYYKKTKLRSVI